MKPINIDLGDYVSEDPFGDALDEMHRRMELAKTLGGTKHDSGKPDLSLVPRVLIEEAAKALMFGEAKYGRYNFRKGFDSHRLVAAALRHLLAYQDGEDNDSESNLTHLAHAAACIGMILQCDKDGTLKDTRFKG